jgi:hypothetical protein
MDKCKETIIIITTTTTTAKLYLKQGEQVWFGFKSRQMNALYFAERKDADRQTVSMITADENNAFMTA